MSLELDLVLEIAGIVTSALDLTTPNDPVRQIYQQTYLDGTGVDEADQHWHDRRTIAASSNDDLDLEGGLVNAFGVTLNPARVKAILIKADEANVNNVVIGNAAANQAQLGFGAVGHTWAVPPGGWFVATRRDSGGWATTAATGDILRLANSGAGTSVTYDIWLILASA